MAKPTGTTTRYETPNSIREDLQDIIYNISPMDTICLSKFARSKAYSTLHEWQTDSLAAASASNAAIEGDDLSAASASDTTRLKNYTQISRKELVVSGTADVVRRAGIDTETAYLVMKYGKELKRDIEAAICQNNAATAGSSASARVSASLETWLYVNQHIKAGEASATTPAPVSGIAGTAPTDGTATGTAFVESHLQTALGVAWANGGETDLILMPSAEKGAFNAFTGIATRFRDVGSRQQAQVIGAADVYVSSFGSHNVMLSRYMRTGGVENIFCLDTKMWGVAYLRPFQVMDIAKSGDSTKKLLLAEWTLVAKAPTSSTKVGPVSTAA
jgi:hypothetical protein